jgi:hypothetical protein
MPIEDMRQGDPEAGSATVACQPPRTLLDGDAHEAKRIEAKIMVV